MSEKFTTKLKCPVCADDYNHFNGDLAGDVTKSPNTPQGIIRIPFKCEALGHEFNVVFSEHEGNIFVWAEGPEAIPTILVYPLSIGTE